MMAFIFIQQWSVEMSITKSLRLVLHQLLVRIQHLHSITLAKSKRKRAETRSHGN